MTSDLPRIGLLWAQFGSYHIDRIEALAQDLAGRAHVLAIEVATGSRVYAWAPSGDLSQGEKITLFPGRRFEDVSWLTRLRAMIPVLRRCDVVFVGIGYHERDILALAWLSRLLGVKLVMMTDSKFEDVPRSALFETVKAALLLPFRAALVAGHRQVTYVRFLGFRKRPVVLGYDAVSVPRIRQEAGVAPAPDGPPHDQRHFLFVGRFVEKKNLFVLLDGYARYVAQAGPAPRRLTLAGAGPLEEALRQHCDRLGIAALVDMPGFLAAQAVSQALGRALCLLLVSTEEQWGLVVNEAVAMGLPAIVSDQVGARDLLLRNMLNGFVVPADCPEAMAQAMLMLAGDAAMWERMCRASLELAAHADTHDFVAGVKHLSAALGHPVASSR